jgi:flagellar hook assembly protein FlgD
LPKASNVTIAIYNSIGQEIALLINNQTQNAGKHQITWNGKDAAGRVVATGVYFYQMKTNDFTMTKKMLLIK